MRTYKLTIAYDGSRYQGWQRQPDTELTIQGILEKAVSQVWGYAVEVNGSGRTDSGVHAKGQTASIVLSGKTQETVFLGKLNGLLPPDIKVTKMELVKNGFHARFSAKGKRYVYAVNTGERPDVFQRKYCFHYPQELDISAMRQAAEYLIGTHDFAGFTDRNNEITTIRTIYDIKIVRQGDMVTFAYDGNGFMYHMVRILTGTLLETGSKECTPQDVKILLQVNKRERAGFLAPACGLFLDKVYYEDLLG